MKINLSYNSEAIAQLIVNDIERKIGITISMEDVQIVVRSKQNYRQENFERGELKCVLDVNI